MSFLGSKSQYFPQKWHFRWCLLRKFCVGYVILKAPLKLKDRKKSLEGRMGPAGRTLAMPGVYHLAKSIVI
jgi:hypothetical protein